MNAAFTRKMSYQQFVKYLLPSILSMVFISFYTTIDGFFVSHFVNSHALATINIIIPLTCVGFGVAIMLATGSGAIVGMKLGEGKKEQAEGFFSFMAAVTFVISIIFTILGLIFLEEILLISGTTPVLMEYAISYGFWSVIMIPAVMAKLFLEYFARVDGSPKLAMAMSISGLILNIVFDFLFIVVMELGIAGAGIGTALSIFLSSLIGIWYFASGRSHLKIRKPKADFKGLLQASYNGSSEMFTEFSTGITTLLFNLQLLKYSGENGVAAMSIVTYLFYFFIAVYFGIAAGAAPVISYSFGARELEKTKETLRYSYLTIIISSVLVFLVSFSFARPIVEIFTADTNVINIAVPGLKLFSFGFLFIGFNIFSSGYFTAVGQGGASAMISLSRSLIFVVVFLFILSNIIGLKGVWLTVPMAELTTILVSLFFILKSKKNDLGYV